MEQMRIQSVAVPKQLAEEEVEVEPLEEQPEVVKLHPRAPAIGRGRGGAVTVKEEAPLKGGKKGKDLIDDLEKYDDDMNEKELPSS